MAVPPPASQPLPNSGLEPTRFPTGSRTNVAHDRQKCEKKEAAEGSTRAGLAHFGRHLLGSLFRFFFLFANSPSPEDVVPVDANGITFSSVFQFQGETQRRNASPSVALPLVLLPWYPRWYLKIVAFFFERGGVFFASMRETIGTAFVAQNTYHGEGEKRLQANDRHVHMPRIAHESPAWHTRN
jgi:hypothetical protein